MIECNICKFNGDEYRDKQCSKCRHGEMFVRNDISEPRMTHIINGEEYCAHCGYIAYKGYAKFYCMRCGGLNVRVRRLLDDIQDGNK